MTDTSGPECKRCINWMKMDPIIVKSNSLMPSRRLEQYLHNVYPLAQRITRLIGHPQLQIYPRPPEINKDPGKQKCYLYVSKHQ